MSGGSLDYAHLKIQSIIESIDDAEIPSELNYDVEVFKEHLEQLLQAAHSLEYFLSGDYSTHLYFDQFMDKIKPIYQGDLY